jgi:hypothetical protein
MVMNSCKSFDHPVSQHCGKMHARTIDDNLPMLKAPWFAGPQGASFPLLNDACDSNVIVPFMQSSYVLII